MSSSASNSIFPDSIADVKSDNRRSSAVSVEWTSLQNVLMRLIKLEFYPRYLLIQATGSANNVIWRQYYMVPQTGDSTRRCPRRETELGGASDERQYVSTTWCPRQLTSVVCHIKRPIAVPKVLFEGEDGFGGDSCVGRTSRGAYATS